MTDPLTVPVEAPEGKLYAPHAAAIISTAADPARNASLIT
jgi:hypothetical protein